jgi:hypothetical protein
MVKESRKIDSLLESISGEIDTTRKNFCFEVISSDNNTVFELFQIFSDSTKIYFPPLKLTDLSFFEWRSYTIFVMEDENHFHLFKKTNRLKVFSVADDKHFSSDEMERLFNGSFRYQEGRFVRQDIAIH